MPMQQRVKRFGLAESGFGPFLERLRSEADG